METLVLIDRALRLDLPVAAKIVLIAHLAAGGAEEEGCTLSLADLRPLAGSPSTALRSRALLIQAGLLEVLERRRPYPLRARVRTEALGVPAARGDA